MAQRSHRTEHLTPLLVPPGRWLEDRDNRVTLQCGNTPRYSWDSICKPSSKLQGQACNLVHSHTGIWRAAEGTAGGTSGCPPQMGGRGKSQPVRQSSLSQQRCFRASRDAHGTPEPPRPTDPAHEPGDNQSARQQDATAHPHQARAGLYFGLGAVQK